MERVLIAEIANVAVWMCSDVDFGGVEPGEGQTQESVIAPGRLAFYQTFSLFRAFSAHPSSESCNNEIRNEILRVQQPYLLKIEKRVDYV